MSDCSAAGCPSCGSATASPTTGRSGCTAAFAALSAAAFCASALSAAACCASARPGLCNDACFASRRSCSTRRSSPQCVSWLPSKLTAILPACRSNSSERFCDTLGNALKRRSRPRCSSAKPSAQAVIGLQGASVGASCGGASATLSPSTARSAWSSATMGAGVVVMSSTSAAPGAATAAAAIFHAWKSRASAQRGAVTLALVGHQASTSALRSSSSERSTLHIFRYEMI
mmetsp:Transcript_103168/g.289028  ORF Transcript_103168/g.289028 Transcript_103168/m.289028 type:complete len:230 (+) Transcript_103168:1053-1742(+)